MVFETFICLRNKYINTRNIIEITKYIKGDFYSLYPETGNMVKSNHYRIIYINNTHFDIIEGTDEYTILQQYLIKINKNL